MSMSVDLSALRSGGYGEGFGLRQWAGEHTVVVVEEDDCEVGRVE